MLRIWIWSVLSEWYCDHSQTVQLAHRMCWGITTLRSSLTPSDPPVGAIEVSPPGESVAIGTVCPAAGPQVRGEAHRRGHNGCPGARGGAVQRIAEPGAVRSLVLSKISQNNSPYRTTAQFAPFSTVPIHHRPNVFLSDCHSLPQCKKNPRVKAIVRSCNCHKQWH